MLYGADGQIEGKAAILSVIRQLIDLSENSLEIDVHDILANDAHAVVLQITKAQLGEKQLEDRVVLRVSHERSRADSRCLLHQ